jgi:HB1, ASXL, restriction endonuclease HTH domain
MEKRTIAQSVIEVLQKAKEPLTAAEITQLILDKELYSFNAKDPRAMVRGSIERRCEGGNSKTTVTPTYFEKLADGRYKLKT